MLGDSTVGPMMENEKPVDPGWLLMFGVVLLGILCYLFLVSDWYWRCAAQIDPATRAPQCMAPCTSQSPRIAPQRQNVQIPLEQRLWPDFGAGNGNYGDVSVFWGSNFASNFFSALFNLAASVAEPVVVTEVIPRWNDMMLPEINRKALVAALSILLGALAKEWAKDLYRLLRKTKVRSD